MTETLEKPGAVTLSKASGTPSEYEDTGVSCKGGGREQDRDVRCKSERVRKIQVTPVITAAYDYLEVADDRPVPRSLVASK
jgi:hypothetical protein